MCMAHGSGGLPAPAPVAPAAPPPPTPVDAAVLAARQSARDRAAQANGRQGTIATGALDSLMPDKDGKQKQLLGL